MQDGSWWFDGEVVRIAPGAGRKVHRFRRVLGEISVPLQAIAGVTYSSIRKGGSIQLRLRAGADPLTEATGGQFPGDADPYRLMVDQAHTAAAEHFADEIRFSLNLEDVPNGPTNAYLLTGPQPPRTASGLGSASFDGSNVRLTWNWRTPDAKRNLGPREYELNEILGVEWSNPRWETGHLRFRIKGAQLELPPDQDPACLQVPGAKRDAADAVLLAAAVAAHLPHPSERTTETTGREPSSASTTAPPTEEPDPDDSDAVLRQIRQLADLHAEGILTDEEFSTAKQALLRKL